MWVFVISFLLLSAEPDAKNVWEEVNAWREGDPIPSELTVVPECYGDDCGLAPDRRLHSVGETQNIPLIRALVLGRSATPMIFYVALGRLLEEDGFVEVRRLLKNNSPVRKEHEQLRKLFQSSVARINVAQVRSKAMSRQEADEALGRLAQMLNSGVEWRSAYERVATQFPDERRGLEGSTLVTYKYSGWLTEGRMDVESQREAAALPQILVSRAFEHGRGILILEGYDGLYLFQVVDVYEPEI